MINVIVLFSGPSNAFQQAGQPFPKNLMEVRGQPLVQHVLEHLRSLQAAGAVAAVRSGWPGRARRSAGSLLPGGATLTLRAARPPRPGRPGRSLHPDAGGGAHVGGGSRQGAAGHGQPHDEDRPRDEGTLGKRAHALDVADPPRTVPRSEHVFTSGDRPRGATSARGRCRVRDAGRPWPYLVPERAVMVMVLDVMVSWVK